MVHYIVPLRARCRQVGDEVFEEIGWFTWKRAASKANQGLPVPAIKQPRFNTLCSFRRLPPVAGEKGVELLKRRGAPGGNVPVAELEHVLGHAAASCAPLPRATLSLRWSTL